MILTGHRPVPPTESLARQESDFTSEGAPAPVPPPGPGAPDAWPVRGGAAAATLTELEVLRARLAGERVRRGALEAEIATARAALARARDELVGMRAEEKRARHLALHDELTELPNRACFRERLEAALDSALPRPPALAVLYIDLDGFKRINDSHGHQVGDDLLRMIAARLVRAVRAGDMMSRIGGDEFACLVPGLVDRPQLAQLAAKLVDAVATPLVLGPLTLIVRPSIGLASCPADGRDADTLIRCADAAMYRAKQDRTGHAFYASPVVAAPPATVPRKAQRDGLAHGIYF